MRLTLLPPKMFYSCKSNDMTGNKLNTANLNIPSDWKNRLHFTNRWIIKAIISSMKLHKLSKLHF